MRILFHLCGVIVFGCLFVMGKLMSEAHAEWTASFWRVPLPAQALGKIFLYSGKFFEVLAFIGALLEVVAVMILASGWIVDILFGLSFAS
jgi:type III secretory pathway component EscS